MTHEPHPNARLVEYVLKHGRFPWDEGAPPLKSDTEIMDELWIDLGGEG